MSVLHYTSVQWPLSSAVSPLFSDPSQLFLPHRHHLRNPAPHHPDSSCLNRCRPKLSALRRQNRMQGTIPLQHRRLQHHCFQHRCFQHHRFQHHRFHLPPLADLRFPVWSFPVCCSRVRCCPLRHHFHSRPMTWTTCIRTLHMPSFSKTFFS